MTLSAGNCSERNEGRTKVRLSYVFAYFSRPLVGSVNFTHIKRRKYYDERDYGGSKAFIR